MLQHTAKHKITYERVIIMRPDVVMLAPLDLSKLSSDERVAYTDSHEMGHGGEWGEAGQRGHHRFAFGATPDPS